MRLGEPIAAGTPTHIDSAPKCIHRDAKSAMTLA
jgi:hypothetical protein